MPHALVHSLCESARLPPPFLPKVQLVPNQHRTRHLRPRSTARRPRALRTIQQARALRLRPPGKGRSDPPHPLPVRCCSTPELALPARRSVGAHSGAVEARTSRDGSDEEECDIVHEVWNTGMMHRVILQRLPGVPLPLLVGPRFCRNENHVVLRLGCLAMPTRVNRYPYGPLVVAASIRMSAQVVHQPAIAEQCADRFRPLSCPNRQTEAPVVPCG